MLTKKYKHYLTQKEFTAMKITMDGQGALVMLLGTVKGKIKIFEFPSMKYRLSFIPHARVSIHSRQT